MHVIGVHGESEKFVVYAMDGVYAGNAGAIPCHLIGFVQGRTYFAGAGAQEHDERFFWFARCVACVDFRDPTEVFRLMQPSPENPPYDLLGGENTLRKLVDLVLRFDGYPARILGD